MPPLPHHRAYGSVPRRFGGLSTGQLFHGKQAQTTQASFGEGAMQSFREAQPPRSLGAEDGRTGRPFGDLKPTELTIALASRLPLDPGDTTQAPSDPAIQRWQLVPLAEAEVPGPTPHERVQVGNHLLQADAPMGIAKKPSPWQSSYDAFAVVAVGMSAWPNKDADRLVRRAPDQPSRDLPPPPFLFRHRWARLCPFHGIVEL